MPPVAEVAGEVPAGVCVPGLGTAARPVARTVAVPEPDPLPEPVALEPPAEEVLPASVAPAGGVAAGVGFGVPAEDSPPVEWAAATVAGVTFGVAGVAFGVAATVAGVGLGVAGPPEPADAVAPVGGAVADRGVLSAGVRPVVPDGAGAAVPAVPGTAGDDELVVTVVREPGPGVTVLWAPFPGSPVPGLAVSGGMAADDGFEPAGTGPLSDGDVPLGAPSAGARLDAGGPGLGRFRFGVGRRDSARLRFGVLMSASCAGPRS
ncbi:hypothetical protein AB0G04_41340 [Actinoplanes sp. NPDC023801]|uniref:hypothetical protein n=1 Tax=Actinoplanes sp. NPDC023801 TaxID=3154595 RepID=UPI0033E91AB1